MLTRYDPFSLWNDSMFFSKKKPVFIPPTDVYEDEKEITVEMELPGMRLEDISINVESNELKVMGENRRGEKKEGRELFKSERFRGSFSRSFYLPKSSNVEEITASYKEGVLYVRIPKQLRSQAKKIEIKA